MTFGLFTSDGPALLSLRLAPLVASTACIIGVIDQQIAFTSFCKSFPPEKRPATLPHWLYDYIWRLIYVNGISFPLAVTTLGANLLINSDNVAPGSVPKRLYQAAFVLTILFFVPKSYATRVRTALGNLETKSEEVFGAMESYTKMNIVRLFVITIPAWTCTFAAVVSQLRG